MFLKNMEIKKFRNLENIKFNFGRNFTLIAGRNGTSKTSLLGLIVQPFKFDKKAGATIFDTYFDTDFSDIHKITKFDEDNLGTIKHMIYELQIDNNEMIETIPVAGYTEKPKTKDKRHRFKAGKAQKGQGNKVHPTIYLGLKRLIPLGEHNDEDSKVPQNMRRVLNNLTFTSEETKFYADAYQNIFTKHLGSISPQALVTKHKSGIGANMGAYDWQSFSAGQDNFAQIIGAIISFQRLKEKMGASYQGGIICIDEVETTFHPSALKKLFEFFRKQSVKLNLQIIMTTHSLQLLKLAFQEEYKSITNVVYLLHQGSGITVKDPVSYSMVESDMFLSAPTYEIEPSIHLICEDEEAKIFLEHILSKELQEKVKIIAANLGGENIGTIASSGLKDIGNLIFILDGDKNSAPERRVLIFPCSAIPEEILYEILESKLEDSSFWKDQEHSSDIYFAEYPRNPYLEKSDNKKTRDVGKDFFKNVQNLSPSVITKAFNCWIDDHKKEVDAFEVNVQIQIQEIVKKYKKDRYAKYV